MIRVQVVSRQTATAPAKSLRNAVTQIIKFSAFAVVLGLAGAAPALAVKQTGGEYYTMYAGLGV